MAESKKDIKTLMHILANDKNFLAIESELKTLAAKLVDCQIKLEQTHSLTPRESNDVLTLMTLNVKTHLFTEDKVKNHY